MEILRKTANRPNLPQDVLKGKNKLLENFFNYQSIKKVVSLLMGILTVNTSFNQHKNSFNRIQGKLICLIPVPVKKGLFS
jgi:hypothetical protein